MAIEVRSAPLPHDITCLLDEALDQDDINAFDHLVLSMFAPLDAIEARINQPASGRGWRHGKGAMLLSLDELAHDTADQLDEQDQRASVAASLVREPAKIARLAECYASWHYEDSTIGGSMKRKLHHARLDKHDRPAGQVRRRLRDQRAIDRYVATLRCDSTDHARALAQTLRSRRPWPTSPDEAGLLERYFDEQKQRYESARQRTFASFLAKSNKSKVSRRQEREARKRVARSAKSAASVLGSSLIGRLARGGEIVLEGTQLLFVVTAPSLRAVGHGSATIELRDRAGAKLGGLCLFFEDTPALEQAASIALHLEAGGEAELLSEGNLYNVTPHGVVNPVISQRLSAKLDQLEGDIEREFAELARRPDVRRIVREERQRMFRDDHVHEMLPRYVEPLTARIWGDHASKLREFTASLRRKEKATGG